MAYLATSEDIDVTPTEAEQTLLASMDAQRKILQDVLDSQKREEKLRLIATAATVSGVLIGLIKLGDLIIQMRRRRS